MASRVHEITTTPVVNVVQGNMPAWERYLTWMRKAGRAAFDARRPPREHAQWVLGRQDFCWTGNVRHWIWVREFTAKLADGREEPWRWRLFWNQSSAAGSRPSKRDRIRYDTR